MASDEIPDWAVRLRDGEARVLETVAQAPLLATVPYGWLARGLQLVATIALLALGTAIGNTAIWVLLAIPLTVVVILALLHGAEDARGRVGRRSTA